MAHCNFQLRGADADGDEEFVRQLAAKYQMPFFSIRFNTLAYADEHRLSVEMAARELRYNWFAQLAAEHHFHRILTAHHLNDNIETMLLNLTRGTGINGLVGISAVNGNIARPLLFATRNQIEEYARLNNLAFRTDCTNLTDDYQRNIVRHRIVPVLKELNPSFEERMLKNFKHPCTGPEFIVTKMEEGFPCQNQRCLSIQHQVGICVRRENGPVISGR